MHACTGKSTQACTDTHGQGSTGMAAGLSAVYFLGGQRGSLAVDRCCERGESGASVCFSYFNPAVRKPPQQSCARVRVKERERDRRGTLIRLPRRRKSHRHNTTQPHRQTDTETHTERRVLLRETVTAKWK